MRRSILVVLVALVIAALACGDTSTYEVRYEVSGTAQSASMTWVNAQGGTEQGDFSLPWSKTFTMEFGDRGYISTQNEGQTGTIICRIIVDGEEFRRSESSGSFSIAGCDGYIGLD